MKSYLITYQLTLPESYYSSLFAYLQTAPNWAKPTSSSWLIKTPLKASSIRDALREKMMTGDRVFVIEVPSTNWATFSVPKEVTNWMKNNL